MRRMRSKKRLTIHFILLLLSAAGILFILATTLRQDTHVTDTASNPRPTSQPVQTPVPTIEPTATPEPTPTPVPTPQYDEAVWMAVGDIMMHKPELPGAYDKNKEI